MPKVSIIVPVFNKEKYLNRTIDALVGQTFSDWELILVNDGSTDHSHEILKEYAEQDERIHLIEQENAGVSVARNRGLDYASGEWIWFVDADDVPEKEFLNIVFSTVDSEVNVIAGYYNCVYDDGHVKKVQLDETGYVDPDRLPTLYMKYQYNNGFWGYLWNKLICRRTIESVKVRFMPGLTLAEDLRFMIEIYASNPRIYLMPCCSMNYTVSAENSSADKAVDYTAQMKIQLRIYDWIVNKQEYKQYSSELNTVISRYAAYVIYYAFENGENYLEKANEIIDDSTVFDKLSTNSVEKNMRPIVKALKNKQLKKISIYLMTRRWIRRIYRTVTLKER